MAKLRFLYGTMGSAKSLRLLTTAYNFEEKNLNFLVLKPSCDTRDGENVIASRVGLKRECITIKENTNLIRLVEEYTNNSLDWIIIDESQFLTEEQVEQLAEIVDEMGVEVMCFGLRTDFKSYFFPGSKRLMELSDEIEEIKSRCSCGRKTSINARFDENGEIMFQGQQIVIGGNEKYNPLCRKCWMERKKNKKNKNIFLNETNC